MNFDIINVSTGPVNISQEVRTALSAPSISHRSKEFHRMFADTTNLLRHSFNVNHAFILSCSGTLANEAMIHQIKSIGGKGLILSNGEFGTRLITQAQRASLYFTEYKILAGEIFDIENIERLILHDKINWLLFCHCETSTGMINDLEKLTTVCSNNNCLCFVDCMSTVGTIPLNLSKVSMASASSGKGLASVGGLAIVLSNIKPVSSNHIPIYIDLKHFADYDGIPFTISSNLVYALHVSIKQKLQPAQFALINKYANKCLRLLGENNLLAYCSKGSRVFTIATPESSITEMVDKLRSHGIIVSSESKYLKEKNQCQIALFGYYQRNELEQFLVIFRSAIQTKRHLANRLNLNTEISLFVSER